jgi:UDP-glucose 4-epimerase
MKIFVTGGAGYIGSHTCHILTRAGHQICVFDNLSSGHTEALAPASEFIIGDVTNSSQLDSALEKFRPDAVVHFAALIEVAESVTEPLKYFRNNSYGSLCLLEACQKAGVKLLVFSSTAAVYGEAQQTPITEAQVLAPINPYGASKQVAERFIQDYAIANPDFRYAILRYFNVAGSQLDPISKKSTLKIGQIRERATHLITLAARAAAGMNTSLKIFGSDYQTPDGTCVRDYIHVDDLAQAHLDALAYLQNGGKSKIGNCGYGQGHSVKEVITAMKNATGKDFKVENSARRAGDPSFLVANPAESIESFKWKPKYNDLELICRSAYDWEVKRQSLLENRHARP